MMMATERDKAVVQLELERQQAMHQGQPWVKDWLADVMKPDKEAFAWMKERPDSIKRLMVLFPPSCLVRTVAGQSLRCPAPGTVGIVQSYFESGNIGVIQTPDGVVRAECQPDWIEAVSFRMPCDPDWMKELLGL